MSRPIGFFVYRCLWHVIFLSPLVVVNCSDSLPLESALANPLPAAIHSLELDESESKQHVRLSNGKHVCANQSRFLLYKIILYTNYSKMLDWIAFPSSKWACPIYCLYCSCRYAPSESPPFQHLLRKGAFVLKLTIMSSRCETTKSNHSSLSSHSSLRQH